MATDNAMRAAILAAHATWSGQAGERFPVKSDWEPLAGGLGTDKVKVDQQVKATVPRVPRVPSKKQYRSARTASPETNALADAWATWVERAAIREYCGAMSRAEAEVLTALELGPCPREPG